MPNVSPAGLLQRADTWAATNTMASTTIGGSARRRGDGRDQPARARLSRSSPGSRRARRGIRHATVVAGRGSAHASSNNPILAPTHALVTPPVARLLPMVLAAGGFCILWPRPDDGVAGLGSNRSGGTRARASRWRPAGSAPPVEAAPPLAMALRNPPVRLAVGSVTISRAGADGLVGRWRTCSAPALTRDPPSVSATTMARVRRLPHDVPHRRWVRARLVQCRALAGRVLPAGRRRADTRMAR